MRDKGSHTLTCMLCHAIDNDIYQRVCICICDFRSWTSGESHHVHVDLVVIDAVEAVVTRNDRRGVCLQQVLRHSPHVGRARAVGVEGLFVFEAVDRDARRGSPQLNILDRCKRNAFF